jgi:hypothetical protein
MLLDIVLLILHFTCIVLFNLPFWSLFLGEYRLKLKL